MQTTADTELAAQRGENMVAAVGEWISEVAAQTSFLGAQQISELAAALNANQYGQYRTLIGAISAVEAWAPAYLAQLKALLKQLLDKQPATKDGLNGTADRHLQRALRDLGT